jgi:hypothetical protein
MRGYVQISEAWLDCPDALHVRYESLVDDYLAEAERLVRFLGLREESEAVRCVLDQYRPERGETGQRGTHFSQGKAERFRQVFSPEELSAFSSVFADYLERLGYPL